MAINDEIYERFKHYKVGGTPSDGPFAITFPYYDEDTVEVAIDNETLQGGYDVQTFAFGQAENNYVVLHAPVSNVTVTVYSDTNPIRTLDNRFVASELSIEIDRIFGLFQEHAQLLTGLNENVSVIIGDPNNPNYAEIIERLNDAERILDEIDALLIALTDRVTKNEQDISTLEQTIDAKAKEALDRANDAYDKAEDAEQEVVKATDQFETDMTKLEQEVEADRREMTSELDNLRWQIDNYYNLIVGFALITDKKEDGQAGASVTVVTGPADLGQAGTVQITEPLSTRDFTGRTSGFSVEIPAAASSQLAAQAMRVAVLARQPQDGPTPSAAFGFTYSKPNDTPAYNSGYVSFATSNTLDANWQWFTGTFMAPPVDSGGPDYIAIWGDEAQAGGTVEIAQILVEPTNSAQELQEIAAIWAYINNDMYTQIQTDSAIAAADTALKTAIEDENGTSVGADLHNNYLTASDTNTAIANADLALKSAIEDPDGSSLGATISQDYYTIVQNADSQNANSAAAMDTVLEARMSSPYDPDVDGSLGAIFDEYIKTSTDTDGALTAMVRSLRAEISKGEITYNHNIASDRAFTLNPNEDPSSMNIINPNGDWILSQTDNYLDTTKVPGLGQRGTAIYSRAVVPCEAGDAFRFVVEATQRDHAQNVAKGVRISCLWLDSAFRTVSSTAIDFNLAAGNVVERFEEIADTDPPLLVAPAGALYCRLAIQLVGDAGGWVDPKPNALGFRHFTLTNVARNWVMESQYQTFIVAQAAWNEQTTSRIDTLNIEMSGTDDGLGNAGVKGEIVDIKGLTGTIEGTALGTFATQMQIDAGGNSAWVDSVNTAISDVEGVTAGIVFRAQANQEVSLLDLFAVDPADGASYSVALMKADDILLDGTVTTKSLTVTEGWGNLIDNGKFIYGDFRGFAGFSAQTPTIHPWYSNWRVVPGWPNSLSSYFFQILPHTGWQADWITGVQPCKAGEKFTFTHARFADGDWNLGAYVAWLDKDENVVGYSWNGGPVSGLVDWSWTTVEMEAPTGATSFRVAVYSDGNSSLTGTYALMIELEMVRKQSGATVIKDGTIWTDHIVAKTITAGNVAGNAFVNSHYAHDTAVRTIRRRDGPRIIAQFGFTKETDAVVGLTFSTILTYAHNTPPSWPNRTDMYVRIRILIDGWVHGEYFFRRGEEEVEGFTDYYVNINHPISGVSKTWHNFSAEIYADNQNDDTQCIYGPTFLGCFSETKV